MAITVTTDMFYTRPGESDPSDVLSAHDPLIWEFEDGAIAANPTATVEFLIKDNAGSVIYTSDPFSAYLLSFSAPTAKFRFDATEIVKHIISTYFYKETSEVIEAENYGSEVEVRIKTFDDAVQEDSKLLEYFGSHALNQIGDEYGSNIPRLFYNDTEEIAHFLGFPNHLFFYLTANWANSLQFIHSTDTKGYDVVPFNGGTSTPIYYYNNKTYQVWMQRVTTGYDSRAMIWAYDHETSVDGANYDLKSVSEVTGDTDYHPRPSVIVADDGHILVAQEFPRIPLGNHNDAITIKRSDNSEDETSWVNAKAETAGYWTFIGGWQGQSPRLAYPHFHKDHSGNIYVICRRYDGSDGRYDRIYKSTDHGVSWDSGHDIVDGSAGIWMYPIAILSGTSDTLRFAIWKLIDGTSTYDKVFYLESDDGGITWHDISNSFSKDTVASGAITLAELENGTYDFTVVTKADVGKLGVTVKTGTINETGNPFILTIDWDAGFTNTDYRMFYWNGNSWDHSIIKGSMLYNTNPVLIHMSGTIFHCYLEETANQMTLYETTDLSTWAKVRDVKTTAGLTANTFVYSQYTNNYKDADYWMLIGVYGTDADYSDIFVETYRSAYSPLVEIIDRDLAVEDSSNYGSLKIGVHCIDLGLLVLSKKSVYARMYYGNDAPDRIKDYNLNIFEPCLNAVYIRLLTKDGYYMYWAFSPFPTTSQQSNDIGKVINSFSEMALANSRNFPIGKKDAFKRLSVASAAVPIVFRRKLMDLFTSPAVYLWQGQQTPGESLISAVEDSVSHPYETFTVSGTVIISAINTVGNGFAFFDLAGASFEVKQGDVLTVIFDEVLNSGTAPSVSILDSVLGSAVSNVVVSANGANIITLIVTADSNDAKLFFSNSGATNFSTSKVILKRAEVEADWILLEGVEGSHNLREKKQADNFSATLVLPEKYTQQLAGQNL
ncbi:hypothetical protein LCGC14_0974780 [marine sediment metagenome]|uniref:Sialidase domain-containing protein n=1 Tax=marine sediment metagenome TaxID=412755 RepID=A0A0F9RH04_9ZZZZ